MVMMLRQCCCGCSLKTGTIITGVLNILGGLGTLINGIRVAREAALVYVDEDNEKGLLDIGVVFSVLGAIQLLVSICLIIGAQNDNPSLVVPWLVHTIVFLIGNAILLIVESLRYFAEGNTFIGVGHIIGVIVFALLETYFLLVVYSLYRELKGTAPP